MKEMEVLFTPADFEALRGRPLRRSTCVVFDILRATSTMTTALAHGAEKIIPVSEIAEAVKLQKKDSSLLLAGEREGLRIPAKLSGGVEFDFGNSPREFTHQRIEGRSMAITTTNGTRALRACAHAREILIGSFLNMRRLVNYLKKTNPDHLVLICSGTIEQAALEDTLAAGALAHKLWKNYEKGRISDSAFMAVQNFLPYQKNILRGLKESRNGKRLLGLPVLKDDVRFCAQVDLYTVLGRMDKKGVVTKCCADSA